MSYEILEGGKAIRCLRCGMTSYSAADVRELYCGNCKMFHEARGAMVRNWPGYKGAFTRNEVAGALRNGTRIVKANSEEGDAHADGELGVVLGSLSHPEGGPVFYFVEWDVRPKTAVGLAGWKVQAVM